METLPLPASPRAQVVAFFRLNGNHERDYDVPSHPMGDHGKRYRYRVGFSPRITGRGRRCAEVFAEVGTVRGPDVRAFPPREVVAYFAAMEGVPLVGRRWNTASQQFEYDGAPPPEPVVWAPPDPQWRALDRGADLLAPAFAARLATEGFTSHAEPLTPADRAWLFTEAS